MQTNCLRSKKRPVSEEKTKQPNTVMNACTYFLPWGFRFTTDKPLSRPLVRIFPLISVLLVLLGIRIVGSGGRGTRTKFSCFSEGFFGLLHVGLGRKNDRNNSRLFVKTRVDRFRFYLFWLFHFEGFLKISAFCTKCLFLNRLLKSFSI